MRKPDPAVLVALTKEPSGRIKTSSVQILDYNLNRYVLQPSAERPSFVNSRSSFDIDDRKGLEIVILTALLTFQDSNDAYHTPPVEGMPPPAQISSPFAFFGSSRRASDTSESALSRQVSELPSQDAPLLPPRPPPKTGIERITELHMLKTLQGEGEANEIEVGLEGSADDYAQYAQRLLEVIPTSLVIRMTCLLENALAG